MYLLFFLLWMIFNGRITVEITLFGIVIAGIVFWFVCKYMEHSIKKEISIYKKFFYGVQYAAVLLWEIVKANLCVIKLTLTSKYEIEPAIVHFRTDLKSDGARAMLANSITLTPGTITVELENDMYCVHCLDKDMAEGLEDSIFVQLLRKIENA